jgi:plastocyanin
MRAMAALTGVTGPRARGGHAAETGNLRGRVQLLEPEAGTEPRPGIAALGPAFYEPSARHRAIVYLETAPQAAFEAGSLPRATMSQVNETFVPHVLAVRAGTAVDFPNQDRTYTTSSRCRKRRFDLGRYAQGRSKEVRFDKAGIVRVFCDIHSHMSAFVLVFAHRFFTTTDEQGDYRIDQVPAGTYTVVAWYEGAVRQRSSVTIPGDGRTVTEDFILR